MSGEVAGEAGGLLPNDTDDVYARSGIGHRVGFGERPAVIVVDLQNGFTDPSCQVGGDLDDVVSATVTLLGLARETAVPVVFTAVGFSASERDSSTWLRKMPGLRVLAEDSRWCEIDPRVAPRAGEPVWVKRASSAFFGTPLHTYLTSRRIDTVVIVGCVTSGCVRATAVDAVSWGYRAIIPLECIGDRAQYPHEANVVDIDAKYADVLPLADVMAALAVTETTSMQPVP